VPRPDTPARIGQAKIKKVAWQPARQISELDPTDQSAAGPAHHRGKTPAENDGDVADLVWKYFAEEITEALRDVQQDLAPDQNESGQAASRRKRLGKWAKHKTQPATYSFVSIRSAPSTQKRWDANNHEESHLPVIDVEALRSIRRIVLTINERIAAMDGRIPGSKLSTTIWGDQGRRPKHFPAGSGCRI
jgi:hypothetical protein